MDDNKIFDGMVVFCAVVEAGSFTAAAKGLGHTVSHVSKEVARLEKRLGTRLMNRTTRKFSLTETGQIFFSNGQRIIADAQSTQAQILLSEQRPFGHLKVSVPVMLAEAGLNRWLPEFAFTYPDITFEIEVSDRYVDIIAESFDVVVRVGPLPDADLISRKLMETKDVTVASPDYLRKHGTPQTPIDLSGHTLISFSNRSVLQSWEYLDESGKGLTVPVSPRVHCDSASMEIALASSGFGITRLPYLACKQEVDSGVLVAILQDFEKPNQPFHALYPSRKFVSPKVRVFVDFLAAKCADFA